MQNIERTLAFLCHLRGDGQRGHGVFVEVDGTEDSFKKGAGIRILLARCGVARSIMRPLLAA